MNSLNLKTLALTLLAAMAFLGCSKPPELHIYTWCDYISPDVLAGFEEANGCKVVVDTFDSNEAMYAKLKAGGTGYDIIMPSSYQIGTMAKEGMIDEIDQKRIPNVLKNFDHALFDSQILDPTFKYNVPYAVTYTGFMYLKDKVPAGADINSWAILGNPCCSQDQKAIGARLKTKKVDVISYTWEVDENSEEVFFHKAHAQLLHRIVV